jgi:hypothetical protein
MAAARFDKMSVLMEDSLEQRNIYGAVPVLTSWVHTDRNQEMGGGGPNSPKAEGFGVFERSISRPIEGPGTDWERSTPSENRNTKASVISTVITESKVTFKVARVGFMSPHRMDQLR